MNPATNIATDNCEAAIVFRLVHESDAELRDWCGIIELASQFSGRVGKPGPSRLAHNQKFAGSNPAPAPNHPNPARSAVAVRKHHE